LCDDKLHFVDNISSWKDENLNVNIFRSVAIFYDKHLEDAIYGPLLIDIDREDDIGHQNIYKALEDTRLIIEKVIIKLEKSSFRIFFSGHKGFNIEINPHILGINPSQYGEHCFRKIQNELISKMGDNFIDPWHDQIRIHGSINSWIANDGKVKNRMKYELSLNELNTLTFEEIVTKSEKLAADYLLSI
jgi:hypothetical protein